MGVARGSLTLLLQSVSLDSCLMIVQGGGSLCFQILFAVAPVLTPQTL